MVDIGFDGFSVAYEREELQFPICVLAGLSTAFLFEAIALPSFALLIAAFVLAAAVYYNIPLVETGTLRLLVNSRGFGVYALGLLPWSNIAAIELITNSLRGAIFHEIRIKLNRPVASALTIDRRALPLRRILMRRPWKLVTEYELSIPADIFDVPAAEIYGSLIRTWKFYRGQR